MKYYKDFQNNVYAFELDGSQDHLIKSGLTQINPNEIDSLIKTKQQSEFDSNDYYRKRLYSYPELGEFVDAWDKNDQVALEEYRQKCLAIKAKYPKPEGF